jgi:two-component system phosphate regulon sensor histidine kinase PhoR
MEVMQGRQTENFAQLVALEDQPHRLFIYRAEGGLGLALADVSEIQRLSRARSDMVANLSHELRTPLTSVRLLADTLTSPTGKDPEVADELLVKMVTEVDTLEQIAQEMLDLASIESGRQVVRMVEERLPEILYEPLARLEEQAARRGVQFEVRLPSDLMVLADRGQAARAVQNVLHNAVKFSPDGGTISIEATALPEEQQVTLSIMDQGPGIPPQELDRIFERFFRGDRARGTPGTGLGLAIARHVMRAHGGEIVAENRRPPAAGSAFHFTFQAA